MIQNTNELLIAGPTFCLQLTSLEFLIKFNEHILIQVIINVRCFLLISSYKNKIVSVRH